MQTSNAARAKFRAARLLADCHGRWKHVEGVASTAELASEGLGRQDAGLVVAAAWLHDIGYAPELVDTGFHPLDGARHLRAIGEPGRLCRLVANHTQAGVEAQVRGLGEVLAAEFPAEVSEVADALTYADLTTGPDGATVTVDERIAEILERYEPGHVVHESTCLAAPELIATVRRVEARLAACRSSAQVRLLPPSKEVVDPLAH